MLTPTYSLSADAQLSTDIVAIARTTRATVYVPNALLDLRPITSPGARFTPMTDLPAVAYPADPQPPMKGTMARVALITAYLAAIIAANLTIAEWGPQMAVYNAFLFIGLDLATRDALHDMWRGHLIRNMAALIAAGSALSYLAGLWIGSGPFVGRIALASAIAFGAAATADAVTYHYLRHKTWHERVNQSNIAGAAVDSVVFALLWPFGFQFAVVFGMFAAKVAGGVVWALILGRKAEGRAWLARNRELYG
jgi:queuosine precursor transporter